jgi:quinol monooxygenase YgiN
MIVVVGRVQTDADRRDALVRIGQAVARASREETGCISYRLYEDTELENEFVFVEEWESSEALQRHFATSHIREFMHAIPEARKPTSIAAPTATTTALIRVTRAPYRRCHSPGKGAVTARLPSWRTLGVVRG